MTEPLADQPIAPVCAISTTGGLRCPNTPSRLVRIGGLGDQAMLCEQCYANVCAGAYGSVATGGRRREFTAAEVALELKAETETYDELSPVRGMLEALHRRLLREEARRDTLPSDVPTFGCNSRLGAAGFKLKGKP